MLKLIPMPIRQYAQHSGRMTRSQYFRWLGILLVVYIVCSWIDLRFIAPMFGYLPFEEVEEQYLTVTAAILLAVPWLSSNIRRLHDVDRTGWWMLMAIMPFLIVYYSDDIGFWLFGSLTEGFLGDLLPPQVIDLAMNSMQWVIIGMAAISFSPVIYWSFKKGSNEPNRFGERQ